MGVLPDPSTGICEPVLDLLHRDTSFLGQSDLLFMLRIWVFEMLCEPVL